MHGWALCPAGDPVKFYADLFPLGGMAGHSFADTLRYLALPLAVLICHNTAYNYPIMRSAVMQVKTEDYILTAVSKGLKERQILVYHVLKNALPPYVAVIALNFGFMAGGAFLVEIPFSEKIILKYLSRVGLNTEVLNRYPSQLSGGELQRIAISRVMSLNPAIIVLDEPTSMLDNITQAQIIRLLGKIQKQKRVSYLFISHDLNLVKLFCKKIYELDRGELNQLGTPALKYLA